MFSNNVFWSRVTGSLWLPASLTGTIQSRKVEEEEARKQLPSRYRRSSVQPLAFP